MQDMITADLQLTLVVLCAYRLLAAVNPNNIKLQ